MNAISTLTIPHFIGSANDSNAKLLIFCDASKTSYATAVYLHVEGNNSVKVNLVFSKSRLASGGKDKGKSKKEMTIPRLELLAVTIGVRAAKFVAKELKFSFTNRILWTDSTCVLHWLKTNKQLPLFVENRVAEIKRASDITFVIYHQIKTLLICQHGVYLLMNFQMPPYGGMDLDGLRNLKCFGLSGVSLRLHLRLLRKPRLILRSKWLHLLVKPLMIKMKDLLSVR